VSEGELLKNKIIELTLKLDKDLIELLLSDKQMKEVFFTEVGKATIFDKDKFLIRVVAEPLGCIVFDKKVAKKSLKNPKQFPQNSLK